MKDYIDKNKVAWEYTAYDFWISRAGKPEERAKECIKNPQKELKKYAQYFKSYQGVSIANICGSCGKSRSSRTSWCRCHSLRSIQR